MTTGAPHRPSTPEMRRRSGAPPAHDAALWHAVRQRAGQHAPRVRGHYFAAFVLDPNSNNIEAVFNTPVDYGCRCGGKFRKPVDGRVRVLR